jgi:hypothetical protein
MKFLSLIRSAETGQHPTDRLMAEMGKLMEEMTRTGALVATAGLMPSSKSAKLRSNYGKLSQTDGPFTETKEVIGGYALLEAPSLDEAKKLVERFLQVHGNEWNVECELRPLASPEFGCRGDAAP